MGTLTVKGDTKKLKTIMQRFRSIGVEFSLDEEEPKATKKPAASKRTPAKKKATEKKEG